MFEPSSHVFLPSWNPLSKSSRVRSPHTMLKPLFVVFCRTLNAKMLHRWRIVLVRLVCPCKPFLAGMCGTMSPCELSGDVKSRRTWDKAMVYWYAIPLDVPSRGTSRWVWQGSGVAVWVKSTTVQWPLTWAMCPARATPWWTSGFPAQSMDSGQSPPGQSRGSQSRPSLSHASPVGLGDVGPQRRLSSPWLDCRGRRDGTTVRVSPSTCRLG